MRFTRKSSTTEKNMRCSSWEEHLILPQSCQTSEGKGRIALTRGHTYCLGNQPRQAPPTGEQVIIGYMVVLYAVRCKFNYIRQRPPAVCCKQYIHHVNCVSRWFYFLLWPSTFIYDIPAYARWTIKSPWCKISIIRDTSMVSWFQSYRPHTHTHTHTQGHQSGG